MENLDESAPPVILKVRVWGGVSTSLAVTVVTAVVFSLTLRVTVAPLPSEVMTGFSFKSWTVTVMA